MKPPVSSEALKRASLVSKKYSTSFEVSQVNCSLAVLG